MKVISERSDQKSLIQKLKINEPNFGRTYFVFSLVLEDGRVRLVVGFVPTINMKVFLMINL
jgi:hypothetical protein